MKNKGIIAAGIIGVSVIVYSSINYINSAYNYQPYTPKIHQIISSDKPHQTGIINKIEPNFSSIGDEFIVPKKVEYHKDLESATKHYAHQILGLMVNNYNNLENHKVQIKLNESYLKFENKLKKIYIQEAKELNILKYLKQTKFLKEKIAQSKTKREVKLLNRDLKKIKRKRKNAYCKNATSLRGSESKNCVKKSWEKISKQYEKQIKEKIKQIRNKSKDYKKEKQQEIYQAIKNLNFPVKDGFGLTWNDYNQIIYLYRNEHLWKNQLKDSGLNEEQKSKIQKKLDLLAHKKSWMPSNVDLSIDSYNKIISMYDQMIAGIKQIEKPIKKLKSLQYTYDFRGDRLKSLSWQPEITLTSEAKD